MWDKIIIYNVFVKNASAMMQKCSSHIFPNLGIYIGWCFEDPKNNRQGREPLLNGKAQHK